MFKNYLMTAWKVFLRRKFFTFVNLFGIAITLSVIMVISAIVDSYLFPTGPEKTSGNYRVIDTLIVTDADRDNVERSGLGFRFIRDNVLRLQTPDVISINSGVRPVTIFNEGQKFQQQVRSTDAHYWTILDFNFIEGQAYSQEDLDRGSFVAVINRDTSTEYFGDESAVGKSITINSQRYQISGVVENVSIVERIAFSDIWIPYTTSPSTAYQQEIFGTWQAVLFSADANKLRGVNDEYIEMLRSDVILPRTDGFEEAYGGAHTRLESLSRSVVFRGQDNFSADTGLGTFYAMVAILIFLFMLLPSINMINLNVSRILERAPEIGVRRAFGASSKQLVLQFLVENVFLTVIGGVLSVVVSFFLLYLVAQSGLIPYAQFSFSLRIFFWSALMILVFGLIAGVYPAIKMSKLNPVTALKRGT